MKRIALLILVAVTFCLTGNAQSLTFYIDTHGDGYTNIRNSASGSKVTQLYDGDMVDVDRCQNGWFHIASRHYIDNMGEERNMPSGSELWVHSSQLGASWISDGQVTVTLRSTASSNGSVVYKGKGASESCWIKSILDYKGSFVKVKIKNGKTGWVPQNIICGNSLTTCN